ncbi:MAG: GNAT family N-acetyltransferase [Kiritimatiellales bacterium]|nr:GNAT family N-acetyltransferase [Kiritimatiellales bacterium]
MKILFTRFPLESTFGGAEVQVLSLMEGLLKRGHAVAFLGSCPTLLGECKKRNIPSAELDIGPPPVTKWSAISFMWRKNKMSHLLKTAIKQFHDLDAVIMLSLSEKLLLTPLLTPSPSPSPSPIWLEHDRVGRWLSKNPWLKNLKALSTKVTTIVVSELSKKIYVKLGWPEDKVITIPNGIDPQRFTDKQSPPLPACPSEATKERRRVGEGPGERADKKTTNNKHIGCISRLTHDKGIDLLIQAVNELPNTQLTIVGSGREAQHISRSVNDQISLMSHIEDLGSFYSSLSVLVLPSREHDPFGLVAAEAMMLGVPVVVTDACGISDYLENGKDAIIVKANSSSSLKKGIEQALASKTIGEEGRKTAMEKFTLNKMVDKYEELLKQREEFYFLDPEVLIDNELELKLVQTIPANLEKNYVPSYAFDMIHSESGEKMGDINVRIGYNENIQFGGHIGYNVLQKFRGHHYATRSCKLVFPFIKNHGLTEIIITCNPDNTASRKTCEAAGGTLVKIVDLPEYNEQYQDGDRQKCIYKFDLKQK